MRAEISRDLPGLRSLGRAGSQPAVEGDGGRQKQRAAPERDELLPQPGNVLRRHEGEEDKNHRVGKIPLWVKLGTLGEDQV